MIRHKVVVESGRDLASVRVNLVGWLQSIGYQLTSPPFLSVVELERGSAWGNMSAIDPRKIRVTVTASFTQIEPEGTRAELEWKIVTAGQLFTRGAVEYWRCEVRLAEQAVRGESPRREELERQRTKNINGDIGRLTLFTLAMIVPGVLSVLSRDYRVPLLVLAAALGFITYWSFRAPRRL